VHLFRKIWLSFQGMVAQLSGPSMADSFIGLPDARSLSRSPSAPPSFSHTISLSPAFTSA